MTPNQPEFDYELARKICQGKASQNDKVKFAHGYYCTLQDLIDAQRNNRLLCSMNIQLEGEIKILKKALLASELPKGE